MANQKHDQVPLEEILVSQVYTVQALIDVLEEKGLLTRDEILKAFQKIQKSQSSHDCSCGCDHRHI